MYCANCKKQIDDGSSFCEYCGEQIVYDYYCNNCGNPVDDVSQFCGHCGADLTEDSSTEELKEKVQSIMQYVGIWIVATLVLGAIGYGISYVINNFNDETTVTSSLTKIDSIEDGMKYLNGKTFVSAEKGQMWFKISFANGSFTLWQQYPSKGEWGQPFYRGQYTVQENRYTDTGDRYWSTKFANIEAYTLAGTVSTEGSWHELSSEKTITSSGGRFTGSAALAAEILISSIATFDITQSVLYVSNILFDDEKEYWVHVKSVKSDYNPWD
jgi:hypothetical protein